MEKRAEPDVFPKPTRPVRAHQALRIVWIGVMVSFCTVCGTGSGTAQSGPTDLAKSQEQADFFKQQVEPVLNRCVSCHSGVAPPAGLDLTTRESAMKGGKSGAALVPNNATRSLLYQMVATKKMPPGAPLTVLDIEVLRQWIDHGAEWSNTLVANDGQPKRTELDWWALQVVKRPKIPEVRRREWVRNSVDAFILAALEGKGLVPNSPADRTTLI